MMSRRLVAFLGAMLFAADAAGVVETMASSVPYAQGDDVQRRIPEGCSALSQEFARFIRDHAAERGVDVVLQDGESEAGHVLKVEIISAASQGNARIWKGAAARGTFYRDGERVASFEVRRPLADSKGSCGVLSRTIRAMSVDIGYWLQRPMDEAMLGEH